MVGFAVGFASVVLLNPVDGLQLYVPFPVAFNVVLDPEQIETSVPAFAVGVAVTFTVVLSTPVHPLLSVTVTVYPLIVLGETVIAEVNALLLHE